MGINSLTGVSTEGVFKYGIETTQLQEFWGKGSK